MPNKANTITIRRTLIDDPDILAISSRMNTTYNEVLGAFIKFTVVFGGRSGLPNSVVDTAVGLPGFYEQIGKQGFIPIKPRDEQSTAILDMDCSEARAVLEAWNAMGKPFPYVQRLSPGRQKQMHARLANAIWVRTWRDAIKKIPQLPGLCGANDRNWVAGIDWFLRPDTVDKILEGRYDHWGVDRANLKHWNPEDDSWKKLRYPKEK